jgi:hypothetical protein
MSFKKTTAIVLILISGYLYSASKTYKFKYKFKQGETYAYKLKTTSNQGREGAVNVEMDIPMKVIRKDFRNTSDIDINIESFKLNGKVIEQSVSASLSITPNGEISDTTSSWQGMNLELAFQYFPKKGIKVKQKWKRVIKFKLQESEINLAIRTNFKGFKTYKGKRVAVFISTFVSEESQTIFGKIKLIGKRVCYFDRAKGLLFETKSRAQIVMYIRGITGRRVTYKKKFGPLIYSYLNLKG